MSNLIPQKRPDKNGRMVTRHVKPQQEPSAALGNLPPVLLGNITLPSKTDSLKSLWEVNRIRNTSCTIDDFDPAAVTKIEKLIADSKEMERSVGVGVAVGEALNLMATDNIPTLFHNVAVFGPVILPHTNLEVTPYITALQEMNAHREIDYLLGATDEERRSAEALVEFTVRAENEIGDKVVRYSSEDKDEILEFTELRDPELTRYIMDHPETMEDVLDVLISEGGSLPVSIIKERLAHGEKALRGGVL